MPRKSLEVESGVEQAGCQAAVRRLGGAGFFGPALSPLRHYRLLSSISCWLVVQQEGKFDLHVVKSLTDSPKWLVGKVEVLESVD